MEKSLAIQQVIEKIDRALGGSAELTEDAVSLLKEIRWDLNVFLQNGIDYKVVVDSLDDSVYITDAEGKVLYVNPAHQKNTGILPEEVLGRYTSDIVAKGDLFTGGSTLDVMEKKTRIFRLANVTKNGASGVGYTVGVPIFDDQGQLHQIVVTSRPVLSLESLRRDYQHFLDSSGNARDTQQVKITKKNSITRRMIGNSPALKKVATTIDLAAPTDATVLITGESGVGKEIVANEIYNASKRVGKTYVKVNCASIPANLLESELFGYEKGAFSGANASGKTGLFETANGGTLLLDEIGDMPMDLQVKLLRAIQEKKITRVGGTRPIDLDIRFIAATNSDLKAKIAAGEFRQDLYYRLNVIPVNIPPLRDRVEDIDLLCDHFIELFSKKHGRHLTLTEGDRQLLRSYSWPGNVRELENVIEYLTICASSMDGGNEEMIRGVLDISQGTAAPENFTLAESVENYEKSVIESVLRSSRSLRDAGEKLGVNASTISRKIKQYGIEYPKGKN